MGFKGVAISLMLVGIFAFALLNFGLQLAADNNANQSIGDHDRLGEFTQDINQSMRASRSNINSSEQTFQAGSKEQIVGTESIQIPAITTIRTSIISTPYTMYKLTVGFIFDEIFGGSAGFAVVVGMVVAMVLALIVFYGWKWIRTGDPD